MMILAATESVREMLLTMVLAIAAGALLILLARRYRLPAIVLLLAGGVAIGPAVWGEHALVQPGSLGDGLLVFVPIAVGLILFEGGLTLDLRGYRSAPSMIKRLLTAGVLITWIGAAAAIHYLVGLRWETSVIAGSLVIVTGPTVIAPLLQRIRVMPRLHSILHWEGVLIDPIGVFIALLCFEWMGHGQGAMALARLGMRVGWGLIVGIGGGWLLSLAVRRRVVPERSLNVFALGFAVLLFALAEAVQSEAGLLAMTVAGFTFGLTAPGRLRGVRQFKSELTDLLIGTLFILLAARLDFDQFRTFGLAGAAVVAIVIFVLRPLSILACAWGTGLEPREKLFLGWVAPRGIVAASMASLFAINMAELGTFENPRFAETFTYSVIIATIVLQGTTAGWLARMLGLQRAEPKGWLVVGAHGLGRAVARFLRDEAGVTVALADTNQRFVREAREEGLTALATDARDVTLHEREALREIGNLLALTDNEDLNVRLCQNWADVLGPEHVYRCDPAAASAGGEGAPTGQVVWPRLARPSVITAELARGEARLERSSMAADEPPPAGHLLVIADGRSVRLAPGSSAHPAGATSGRALYLVRMADHLLRSVHPELVGPETAGALRPLFESIVARIVRLRPALPREEMVQELLDRQAAFPMGIGHGVAVPHAYSSVLDARLCAVAQTASGVDFGAHDGEPVRLVFLLLSPPGDPEGHLATLAEIARLTGDHEVREALIRAPSPEEVIRIIRGVVEAGVRA